MVGGHFAQLESDMWSLGVMLFMMLSGGLSPFWAGNDYKTSARVVAGDFRPVVRPPDQNKSTVKTQNTYIYFY